MSLAAQKPIARRDDIEAIRRIDFITDRRSITPVRRNRTCCKDPLNFLSFNHRVHYPAIISIPWPPAP
jgi:hypothetical protein